MLYNSSTPSRPSSSTLTDKRESQPYDKSATWQTYKLQLVKISSRILLILMVLSLFGSVVGVLFEGRLLTYAPVFLMIGVIGTSAALILAKPATLIRASWLLVGTLVFIFSSTYLETGTGTPMMVFFLLPMFLAVILLNARSVLLVSGFCILFITSQYILQDIIRVYLPSQPSTYDNDSNVAIGLFITVVLLPALVILVGTALHAQARASQAQNAYLQRTLDELNLHPQTGETVSQNAWDSQRQASPVTPANTFWTLSAQGSEAVPQTIQVSQEVGAIYQALLSTLTDLNTKNSNMQLILQIVTSVSSESRLLALNAAIEAAGAGGYGSRFAVVVQEVKELAVRLGATNQQVAEIIEQIQRASQTTGVAANQNYPQV